MLEAMMLDKEGQKKYVTEIQVNELVLLGGGRSDA